MRKILVLSLLIATILLQGCAIVFISDLWPRKQALKEVTIEKAEGLWVKDKILLIDISGVLATQKQGMMGIEENPVAQLREILEKAENDDRIKVVILRINSPGGTVTACDNMYRELKEFKKQTGKKVYAALMGVGASGGYYVALAADKIYAHPTTITGSIGVLAFFPSLEGLADKLGVKVRVIKSGDKKDLGSLWREFSPEEQQILQGIIDDLYNKFVAKVTENRPTIQAEKISELADGRVFVAQQAKDYGLIDDIAYLDDLIEIAKKEAEIKDAKIVTYKRPYEYKANIYDRAFGVPTQEININLDLWPGNYEHLPVFQYLWLP